MVEVVALQNKGNGCMYWDAVARKAFLVAEVIMPGPGKAVSQAQIDESLKNGWLKTAEFLEMIGARPQRMVHANTGPLKAAVLQLFCTRDDLANKNQLLDPRPSRQKQQPIRRLDRRKTRA